ncbi:MAG: carbonic anhydrase family protein [Magnetococcales bacterium]|nr:carbonic anhydrase family protein [Magnetococcales bacterium]
MRNRQGGRARALVVGILLAGSTGAALAGDHPGGAAAHHWGYEGAEGPNQWGSLGFPACSTGKSQSPIDLQPATEEAAEPIPFDYKPAPVSVVNNGHTIQFTMPGTSSITLGGKKFTLAQFHFHSGSEHTLKGRAFPMEVHLVHKAEDGELAVVGVFLTTGEGNSGGAGGAANATLDTVFGALPGKAGLTLTSEATIDPAALLPAERTYYKYKGSLTTPPCSEGVNWFVMATPMTISTRQLLHYTSVFMNNARPPQPLNGRTLSLAK